MKFNDSLKEILESKNLRQADLCRMTGIQTSLMSDYMSGKKGPTIGNAILIADALNISLDRLVGKELRPRSDDSIRSKIFDDIYEAAMDLTDDELLYILDNIKALKKRLGKSEN